MSFTPKKSQANQVWLLTLLVVLLALGIEMQPQTQPSSAGEQQAKMPAADK